MTNIAMFTPSVNFKGVITYIALPQVDKNQHLKVSIRIDTLRRSKNAKSYFWLNYYMRTPDNSYCYVKDIYNPKEDYNKFKLQLIKDFSKYYKFPLKYFIGMSEYPTDEELNLDQNKRVELWFFCNLVDAGFYNIITFSEQPQVAFANLFNFLIEQTNCDLIG